MVKRDIDLSSGLGDIDHILRNQSVADLSWLSVDEEDYRKSQALPKQNLDTIPSLVKALEFDPEDDIPRLIPLRPHTLVNSNPLEAPPPPVSDLDAPIRNRVARLVMAGVSDAEIAERLSVEFPPREIIAAQPVIDSVLSERGLLGNVYIDASHFPHAARDSRERKAATDLGKKAIFVIAGCGGCNGCNCYESGFCKTFGGKRVVSEVPYGSSLTAQFASTLATTQRLEPIDFSAMKSKEDWKRHLQSSFLNPINSMGPEKVRVVQHHAPAKKPVVTASDVKDFWDRKTATIAPPPSHTYLKFAKRMATGHNDVESLSVATDPSLRALASEYGLLGHTWIDMDAMGGCKHTADLIRKNGFAPDFVLRRASVCEHCNCAPNGGCESLKAVTQIVASKPSLEKTFFVSALERGVRSGRIASTQAKTAMQNVKDGSNWGALISQTNLFRPVAESVVSYSGSNVAAFHGSARSYETLDGEAVRRTISHLMNTGLQGKPLKEAILSTYSREGLASVSDVGRRVASEEGIQGSYFIDPTAYDDYGRGCTDGAKLFRNKGPANVLASSACTGCSLQTAPGRCSKYSKDLIRSVPTDVRAQYAAEKRRLPMVTPLEKNVVKEFEVRASELPVDLKGYKNKIVKFDFLVLCRRSLRGPATPERRREANR